ncbi:MAG: MerR family transcriptional regulator [Candidatus Hodarchaeales archaeon]
MKQQVRIGKAARHLGVCTKTIRKWDHTGKIKCARKIGGIEESY